MLLESLSVFPDNTILLELYAFSRSRFGIEDRLHAVAEDSLSRGSMSVQASLVVYASDIAEELRRSNSSGGTVDAVRAAFDRAVESRCQGDQRRILYGLEAFAMVQKLHVTRIWKRQEISRQG